jgi:hypothetical protein
MWPTSRADFAATFGALEAEATSFAQGRRCQERHPPKRRLDMRYQGQGQ